MMALLLLLTFMVYLPSLRLGFTELDDSIFIHEIRDFYRQPDAFLKAFQRGVFHETKDIYYRPLLLNSFLLSHKLSGEQVDGWRMFNILLHGVNVLLVYLLLLRLQTGSKAAVFLAAVFAVHPVLTQAVVWIPGRNDSLLGLFVFSYLLLVVRYAQQPSLVNLLGQLAMLLGAFFTKESGVLAPLAGAVLWVFALRQKIWQAGTLQLLVVAVVAFSGWYGIRSMATLDHQQMAPAEMGQALLYRWPTLALYLGKILLPVNLSVFPMQQDTHWLPAVLALLGLMLILIYAHRNGSVQLPTLLAGAAVYVVFLIPALLVPLSFNDQDFEHRLYVPLFGILLALSGLHLPALAEQRKTAVIVGCATIVLLAAININRHRLFGDPIIFWERAVADSPSSAYAKMMLAARLDKKQPQRADSLMRLAFRMDSSMKYVNYYMGVLLQAQDSVLESEPYLLRELPKSDFSNCYFHLARVAFEKGDKQKAIKWLEEFLRRVPDDEQGNNNLMLLYYETGQREQLRKQVAHMRQLRLPVPDVVAAVADAP